MDNKDFTLSFIVDKSPQQVFESIKNVRGWWSEGLEGASQETGDEFIYRHQDMHYSKHRVTALVPGKQVVWLTLDASINFVENKDEWDSTEVFFNITEENGKTKLEFIHKGLQPVLQCYNGCGGGWKYYIGESLRNLVETGQGNPDPKEE